MARLCKSLLLAFLCLFIRTALSAQTVTGKVTPGSNQDKLKMAVVVSRQKTLAGQEDCRRYAQAITVGDHATALAVCHALIATEQERVAR